VQHSQRYVLFSAAILLGEVGLNKKKKKREMVKQAQAIIDAARALGALPESASVEIKVNGRRKRGQKTQSKPGRRK
jgi:hypothetical protein